MPHERAAARSGRDACSGDLVASFAAGPGRDHVCGTGSADGAVLVWRDAVLVTVLSAVHLGPVLDLAVHLPPKDGPAGSIRSGGGGDDGAASRKEPAVVVTAGRDGWLRFLEVTCGADGVLRVWDALGCRPMFAMTLHHTLHHGADSEPGADGADDGAGRDDGTVGRGGWSLVAAEYSSEWGDCCHLAVAMVPRGPGAARSRAESSRVVVLRISDAEAGREIPVVCVLARREGLANRRVTCLRYSAGAEGADDDDDDGGGSVRLLAVGTWDGCIVIYAADHADDSYVRRAVLRGHSRPVTSLDFAAGLEPASLQSNSAWELKFWDMAAMRARKTPSADRDTRWCRAAAPLPARAVHGAAPCWGPRHSPASAAARGFVAGKLKAGKAAVAVAAASGVNSHAAQAPCAPPCAR